VPSLEGGPDRLGGSQIYEQSQATLISISTLVLTLGVLGTVVPGDTISIEPADVSVLSRIAGLVTLGSEADERLRLAHLTGEAPTTGYLLRSPSTLSDVPVADGPGLRWWLLKPELRTVWNSRIPLSLNEGAMWGGRGMNTLVMAGVAGEWSRVRATLAPQWVRSANRDFQLIRSTDPSRSSFVPPWYLETPSIDLPYRPGDRRMTRIDPGQSSLRIQTGPVVVGVSSENQWWGPGLRAGIVMSGNAPGIPHAFLRTSRPVQTGIGQLEARWMVGGLTESLFFDTVSTNDVRSISAAAVTFRPAIDDDLTFGAARAVYSSVGGAGSVAARSLDVITRGSPSDADATFEQILSVFARWVLPADGLEVFGEWARLELPSSFRELVAAPQHTQGYTLGLQWARPLTSDLTLRLQAEATYLEQSNTFRVAPTPGYYVSDRVPQGYTHHGQVIGAAIGPGASSQWIAADLFHGAGRFGAFLGRVRWDNDAYYRQPTGASVVAHDVSILSGVRGGVRVSGYDLQAELVHSHRMNYLYQNLLRGFGRDGAVDRGNVTLRFLATPRPIGTR
jgi:hypothetical protein